MSVDLATRPSVRLLGPVEGRAGEVLTAGALDFLADLHRRFNDRRLELLALREERQTRFDCGDSPDVCPRTARVRAGDWKVAPIPPDLLDRRVEVSGPADRATIVSALTSGARVFMADFEDAAPPTWRNLVEGQVALKDRWSGTLAVTDARTGRRRALDDGRVATLIVRPRGWHLPEAHALVDGEEISGALFDFGLYLFHNARAQAAAGSGPYFYLPKLENHLEARLWNEVFLHAQAALGLPRGTIRATVLIETLPAAFEMDEILYELREHVAGLSCGRRDHTFSFIKRLKTHPEALTPDRMRMEAGSAFLAACSLKMIQTCHRRGALALGGASPHAPVAGDTAAGRDALARLQAEQEWEAASGHDGTRVAHPGLVPAALEAFDRLMPGPNQLDVLRDDARVDRADLLAAHSGPRTEEGLRGNVGVAVRYIAAWLAGGGGAPLSALGEDTATAEICRAQTWQWLRHGAKLEDGREVTEALVRRVLDEEMAGLRATLPAAAYDEGRFGRAGAIFTDLVLADTFEEFLTLPAYRALG